MLDDHADNCSCFDSSLEISLNSMPIQNDEFLDPPFIASNLDRALIRRSIVNAIHSWLPIMGQAFLDIGCGRMPYRKLIVSSSRVKEYIGLDLSGGRDYGGERQPDFTWDGATMPFRNSLFDSCMATEVLEHCPDPGRVLQEAYRVLKPGGMFFFTVPFLWNLHEVPHDEYRYTPFALERLLRSAGFSDIRIEATGGWHASMAQMLGLWVRRSPLSPRKRRVLSHLLKPVIGYLVKNDVPPKVFKEGTMITGLCGTARKLNT